MDKITNILNPGKKHDDEILYGSGNSSDPLHSGTTGTNDTTGATGTSSSTTGNTGLGSSTAGTHGHDTDTSNAASGLGSGTTGTHDPLTSTTDSAHGATSGRTAGSYDDDASSTTAIKGGVSGANTHSGSALTDTNKPLPNEPGRLGTFGHLEEGARQNEPFSSSTGPGQTTGTTSTDLTGSHHTGSGLTGSQDTAYPTTDTSTTSAGVAGTEHSSRALPDRSVGGSTTGAGSKTDEILAVAATRGERGAEELEDPKHRQYPQSTSDNTATSSVLGSSTHHPSTISSGLGPTTDPTDTGSHLGRDAGLGGATLGGAGLAEHEHNRGLGHTTGATDTTRGTVGGPDDWEHSHTGHGHAFEGDPCGPGVPPAGPHFVEGPHATDTANRLDPHADTTGPHTHGSSATTTGLESTDRHMTGRDAALAGGAGVAGVGAHEEGRHHHHDPTSSGTTSTETDPSLTGPVHKSSLLNKLDPRVKSADATGTTGTTGTSSEHHHGRDVAGGAALGATGYEAEKHHHHKDHTDPTSTTGPTRSTGLGGSAGLTSSIGIVGTSDRHLGRDAAGGAAIGAAGHEPEKHHHHTDQTDPTNTTGTTGISPQYGTPEPVAGTDTSDKHHHSHHDKETHHEKKHEKEHEKEHEKKHGGLLGFLHRDKTNKAEEPEHHDKHQDTTHHQGHDAATTGAVGAGAAGVAEHEHEKHERNRLHKDPPASMMAAETESGYGEKPTSGYASQVTGGTGTTALAQGKDFHRGSHLSGVGNRLDPAVDDPVNAPGASVAGNRAVDPVTGLPTDTSQKFEGFGTDDAPHHGTTGVAGPLSTGADATSGGPLTSRREEGTGEQLTAGGKYHDPVNMGYGEGLASGTETTGSTGKTGTHHGLSAGAPHTGPSGSAGI